jgi:hypothetical protein
MAMCWAFVLVGGVQRSGQSSAAGRLAKRWDRTPPVSTISRRPYTPRRRRGGVATLVARGLPRYDVFATVAAELARCLRVQHSALVCLQPDCAALLLAAHDVTGGVTKMRVGERFSVESETVASTVWRTGRAARMDSPRQCICLGRRANT